MNTMKYIAIALLVLLMIDLKSNAQTSQNVGVINLDDINKMEVYHQSLNDKGIQNAVRNNSLKDISKSRFTNGSADVYFSNRVKTKGITDQKQSNRCWLYTGLNMLRPIVIERFKLTEFEFSQSYLYFYDQLEKSNLFLENVISTATLPLNDPKVDWLMKNPIGDGGQWTGVVNLIEKYGVVPSEVMPESYQALNTSILTGLLSSKLRENALILRSKAKTKIAATALQQIKIQMLSEIYHILAVSLGEPPKKFTWRFKNSEGQISAFKEYDPKGFYAEFVGINLRDYVMLMNDPSRPYNKLYEIENDRHILEGTNWKYINLDIDQIKSFAIASIKDNQAMYFSCDVGKQLDSKNGFLDLLNYDYESVFKVKFTMDKSQRIQTFASSSSHGMVLVAVDINEENKATKWLLENSWGNTGFDGHLVMSDDWFGEYMFRLVVNKKYITPEVLEMLNQQPTLLPPWDPMFSQEL